MKILQEVSKEDLKYFLYHSLDIEDDNIYKEANDSDKIGIFQLTAGTANLMVSKIKPSNFNELNACNAFARPGTMDFVDSYIENREENKSSYPKEAQEVLKETNQIILYQEQMLQIFQVVGGFTLEEADSIRGLTKKLGKLDKDPEDLKKWEKVLKKFKTGAEKKGISESESEFIAGDLIKMSSYQFNKAHSTSYTYIAVMTLYLSYYFRKYFYSSIIQYEVDKDKYLPERMASVKNHGFKILPPDINNSKERVAALDGNEIILGIADIKGVGENASAKIVESQPFENFFDYVMRTRSRQVTSAVTTALLKIGAFDSLINKERKKYIQAFTAFWKNKGTTKVLEKLEQKWEEALNAAESNPFSYMKESDFIEYEKEVLGFNFFTSPFTEKRMEAIKKLYEKNIVYYNLTEVTEISKKIPISISEIRTIKDKNSNEMAFVEIEDPFNNKQSIPVFASYWKILGPKFLSSKGKIILMNVFRDSNNKILFGQRGFVNESTKIIRMFKEIP